MIKTYHFSPNTPVLRDIAINMRKAAIHDAAQSLPCIVFCASVLESFINESCEYRRYLSSEARSCYTVREYAFEMYKMVFERERLQDKYFYTLKLFFASDDFKSHSVFESFKILVEVRNAIVHNKPEVMITGGAVSMPNIGLKSYPKFIRQLKSKRVISQVDGATSWIDLLQSEEVAAWSVDTMNDMIQLFISALDDGEFKDCFVRYYE
ncbi:hypothetical protein AB6D20_022150 [Vibrio splendidus]